ncbi:hypothetical protein [Terribacillus sp. DMT04]|uniref:hypothetical protein n=1 Tax=Terribacillus sp. DMT04 TaxID=2850441 RepID=UPI001C2C5E03|nr:hypothetical protein [Terribacillus sp. DMT04]QXE03185.1 hypothetical protein KS242_08460 [Terribacillus sp. DMT04]
MNKRKFLQVLALSIMMGSLLLSVLLSFLTEIHPDYIDILKIVALCVALGAMILSFIVNDN